MKIIVDTCIWSLALRRHRTSKNQHIDELRDLIQGVKVQMIGPIRQEILSGVRSKSQFDKLKNYLSVFPDLELESIDFELAAEFYNMSRKKGIQGTNTDFLICALSNRHHIPIYTLDKDFTLFEEVIPIILYKPTLLK